MPVIHLPHRHKDNRVRRVQQGLRVHRALAEVVVPQVHLVLPGVLVLPVTVETEAETIATDQRVPVTQVQETIPVVDKVDPSD